MLMKRFLLVATAVLFMAVTPLFATTSSSSDVNDEMSSEQIQDPLSSGSSVETVAAAIDWEKLDKLVEEDETLSTSEKTGYDLIKDIGDPTSREKALRKAPYYKYLRENLYPKALK